MPLFSSLAVLVSSLNFSAVASQVNIYICVYIHRRIHTLPQTHMYTRLQWKCGASRGVCGPPHSPVCVCVCVCERERECVQRFERIYVYFINCGCE